MDIEKLEKLLKQPEGFKLDFKEFLQLETESDKKNLLKMYVQLQIQVVGEVILFLE